MIINYRKMSIFLSKPVISFYSVSVDKQKFSVKVTEQDEAEGRELWEGRGGRAAISGSNYPPGSGWV